MELSQHDHKQRGIVRNNKESKRKYPSIFFDLYGTWDALDRSEFIAVDVGVFLDTFAIRSENLLLNVFCSWVGDHSTRPKDAIGKFYIC